VTAQADPAASEPWKINPQQWHLSQRGIHHRHTNVRWKPPLLLGIVGTFSKLLPGLTVDWSRKVLVAFVLNGEIVATVVTNQPQGLRLHLRVPRNSITPAQTDRLGVEPNLRAQGEYDEVFFWARALDNLDKTQLQTVAGQMAAHATALREKSA
jgi:hypothetical protein